MSIYRSIQILSIFLFVRATAGCGTKATITRVNAPPVEAEIVGGDQENIYVELAGGTMPIAREEIEDIDHPGNVAAVIGGLVSAYGIANLALGLPQCEKQGPAFCTGVILPATIGLPVMIYGIAVWARSRGAANPTSDAPATRITVLPTASFQKSNSFVGASVAGAF